MLETMLALKNNDMRKIPGYDPEPVERLRKLQRTLVGDFSHGHTFLSSSCMVGSFIVVILSTTRWHQSAIFTDPNCYSIADVFRITITCGLL